MGLKKKKVQINNPEAQWYHWIDYLAQEVKCDATWLSTIPVILALARFKLQHVTRVTLNFSLSPSLSLSLSFFFCLCLCLCLSLSLYLSLYLSLSLYLRTSLSIHLCIYTMPCHAA